MFHFEKLDLWSEAIDFADLICRPVFASVISSRQQFLFRDNCERIYFAAQKQSRMRRGLRKSLLDS